MTVRQPLRRAGALLCALFAMPAASSDASDHADTAANYNRPGADLADVFIFPSTTNANNVVLVMDVHPLIPAGQAGSVSFDPNVLYQFRIDNTGDNVEDLVIQARFSGTGAGQRVLISGPYKPNTTGTVSVFARPYATQGTINQTFAPAPGMTVFAGPRSDPFFFDLQQLFAIFPDRATPAQGVQVDFPSVMAANTPQTNGFRGFPAGSGFNTSPANDLLASFNVLSIIVELPRSMLLTGATNKSIIGLWETTSILSSTSSFNFNQQDRLARPAINEALASVSQSHHDMNNKAIPTTDSNAIQKDIAGFLTYPAGRSAALSNLLQAVLVPDVMKADLSSTAPTAAYLGVETMGASGSTFGGRALTDDVIDIDLGAVFGNLLTKIIPLVTEDNKELPQFATDNIGPHTDYQKVFPYLGNPR